MELSPNMKLLALIMGLVYLLIALLPEDGPDVSEIELDDSSSEERKEADYVAR